MTARPYDEELRSALRAYLDRNALVTGALTDDKRTESFMRAFDAGALLVPEEFGGAGGSPADAAVVAAEAARALLGGEVLAALLGAAVAAWAPASQARQELLAGIASGSTRVTVPVWTTAAGGEADSHVLGGFPAHKVLVFLRAAGEFRLRCADVTADMVRTRNGIDPTRPLARLELAPGTPGTDLAVGATAERLLARYIALAHAILAAEQVAGARRSVELTVGYASQRTQFGVPIASFQAVKHACATMHVNTCEAEALAALAALAVGGAGEGDAAGFRLAAQAKALASEAFTSVARSAIEVHGGVGFAWEHPVQLFYKRSLATAAYFGRPAELYAAATGPGIDTAVLTMRMIFIFTELFPGGDTHDGSRHLHSRDGRGAARRAHHRL